MDVAFREFGGRSLFLLTHGVPFEATRGTLLVPPFGEEMNRCRRFFLMLSQNLARNGHFVTLADLSGTGDSAGELETVAWDEWVGEVERLIDFVAARTRGRANLVAVRSGALLAFEASCRSDFQVSSISLIDPVNDGSKFVNELLRLKLAAALSSGARVNRTALWADWQAGRTVCVAGYRIPAKIALPLSSRSLSDFPLDPGIAVSIYQTGQGETGPSKSAPAGITLDVAVENVIAPSWWRQTEPEPVPALVEALVSNLALEFAQ